MAGAWDIVSLRSTAMAKACTGLLKLRTELQRAMARSSGSASKGGGRGGARRGKGNTRQKKKETKREQLKKQRYEASRPKCSRPRVRLPPGSYMILPFAEPRDDEGFFDDVVFKKEVQADIVVKQEPKDDVVFKKEVLADVVVKKERIALPAPNVKKEPRPAPEQKECSPAPVGNGKEECGSTFQVGDVQDHPWVKKLLERRLGFFWTLQPV